VTYLLVNAAFMVLAALVAVPLLWGTRMLALTLTLLALLGATAIGDNLIIAFDIVAYDADKIVGLLIGLAPIEDFAYSVVAAALVPGIWLALERRRK
jgi:lycopene cyclase domain-containing protein